MEDGCNMEQERHQLIQQWREQQICVQARVKSIETTIELLESVDIQIALISDQLKQISQKPLNVRNFAVVDARNLHEELKCVDESIKKELFLLNERESLVGDGTDLSHIELQTHLPLQQTLHNRTKCLEQQRHCVQKSESALVALEKLLSHLQQLNDELNAHRTSDQSYSSVSFQKSLEQVREDSLQLDTMLDDAGLRITLDDKAGSCVEMVSALEEGFQVRLVEGQRVSDGGRKGREKQEKKEERAFGRKRMGLLVTLREVLAALERHVLKEPTLPALQHRLRFLTDMESKLHALRSEIDDLRDANTSDTNLSELQTQWETAHRSVTESREQCASLTELLKKFQSCRNNLGGTLQRAEQTIGDQASYMGKDNLQLLISKVISIKSDLSGLGDGVEEFRSVCRQLQSLVRRVLDCTDAPFESEADTLMDRWLDVTEKTDCYLDNLQAGFSLWEKLLLLAEEVEGWSAQKLMTLAQSNPFQTEVDVSALQNELKVQEENINHFHRRSSEIQELLQSQEFPLELQVIESQLRKKVAEVKELFFETKDVFRQLETAKMQVASEIADHLSSLQTITDNLNALNTSESTHALNSIQRLSEQLEVKAEQADALLQQMDLLASIAGLENLQTLSEAGAHLQESIRIAKELNIKKGEQTMNPNKPVTSQPVEESKHTEAHIEKVEDTTELQTVWDDKADEQSQRSKAKDAALEQKYFKEDILLSEDENWRVTPKERLTYAQSLSEPEVREDDSKMTSPCGSPKPIFTIVLDSDLSKSTQNLPAQTTSACSTQWHTVSVVHDRTTEKADESLTLEAKPSVSVAEEHAVLSTSDESLYSLYANLSTSGPLNENNPTDDSEPTCSVSDQDFKPKTEKGSSTKSLEQKISHTSIYHGSSKTAKKVFTIILDADSPELSLVQSQSLSQMQRSGTEFSRTDEFSHSNVKNQQRSSSRTEKALRKVAEKDNVKSSSSKTQEALQHNISEIMKTDIEKNEKEKQYEVMDVHKGGDSELGFLVHEQDVTMSESRDKAKKIPSAVPLNKAKTLQKPQNVAKGRKKIKKSGDAKKSDGFSGTKLKTSESEYKMTADSESRQTSEITVLATRDTSLNVSSTCSQSKSTEAKLTEAVDTKTLNLHTEAKQRHFGTVGVVKCASIEATEMSLGTGDIVQSKLTEKSMATEASPVMRAECITQIPAAIVDVNSTTLLSDSHQSLLQTQHTGLKDSKTKEFAYKDAKTQQRSSAGTVEPEEQEPERLLSKKYNVKSLSSVLQEALQPNTSEIMETDIEKRDKEKQHKVTDAETSSQIGACAEDNESGIKTLKQDVTMSDKHTFAEPSNDANALQKPPNVAKGRKKIKKSVDAVKKDNISSLKLKASTSEHKTKAELESLQTSEMKVPDTTDTSLNVASTCSQSKRTEDKHTEAVGTVQEDGLNLLQTEAKHGLFGTVAVSVVGGAPIEATDIGLETADIVQSKHTEKSMAADALPVMRAEGITQIPAVVVNVKSPTFSHQPLLQTQCTDYKDTRADVFAHKDTKTQQRSSAGTEKPEEQEHERFLLEKDIVKPSRSEILEALQINTSEIMETDIEKEKQHEVIDTDTLSQMCACAEDNESGIKTLKQNVTMSDKDTFAEPSNEANTLQNPPNVGKVKKKIKKSACAEKSDNISSIETQHKVTDTETSCQMNTRAEDNESGIKALKQGVTMSDKHTSAESSNEANALQNPPNGGEDTKKIIRLADIEKSDKISRRKIKASRSKHKNTDDSDSITFSEVTVPVTTDTLLNVSSTCSQSKSTENNLTHTVQETLTAKDGQFKTVSISHCRGAPTEGTDSLVSGAVETAQSTHCEKSTATDVSSVVRIETKTQISNLILDVDSPEISSHTQCEAPESPRSDEFALTDFRIQQRSSSGTEKHKKQEPEQNLLEKDYLKSSFSVIQKALQPNISEITETIVYDNEKDEQHEDISSEISSQISVLMVEGSKCGFVVHKQDKTMSESHGEADKITFAEPSSEANTLQKLTNIAKGRKKISKSALAEKSNKTTNRNQKTSRSEHNSTADSESLQTSEIILPDTTDTSLNVSSTCSQSKTTKSVSSEDKLSETVDTETLNLLQTEAKLGQFGTVGVVECAPIEATESVVLKTEDSVQSKHAEKSMPTDASQVMRAEHITQIPAVIVDVDSPPLLLSGSHQSLLQAQCTDSKGSREDINAYKDAKTQQRSSAGTEKPEEQEPKGLLLEKYNVKSSCLVIHEAFHPNTSEIMETDIEKCEKVKQHVVTDAETSSHMDARAEDNRSGIKTLQQGVTMSEKQTSGEPSNEANAHQKSPNVAKCRKKIKKSADAEKSDSTSSVKLTSQHKRTADSESLQTSEIIVPDTTDISLNVFSRCSQLKTTESLRSENKLTKAGNTVQEETLNLLHTEAKDGHFATDMDSETADIVESKLTEKSMPAVASPVMRAERITQIPAVIVDVDSPTLLSDSLQSQLQTQCTDTEGSRADVFSHTDVKTQQRSSAGTEKPEEQEPEGLLSEKDNVKSLSFVMQEALQPNTSEIRKTDIEKVKHVVTDAETSSHIDARAEDNRLGIKTLKQEITISEIQTSAEPSNEANVHQKTQNDGKGRKKIRKSADAEKSDNISTIKLVSRSENKSTTDSKSLQTSEIILPVTTDTSLNVSSTCSQSRTTKSVISEEKLTEALNTVQEETLHLLQTEARDGYFGAVGVSVVGGAHVEATDSVVLGTRDIVQSKHTEKSAPTEASPVLRAECITQIPAVIVDVDSPTLLSESYQSLLHTQCTGPKSSKTEEFSYTDVRNQWRSSAGTEGPEKQKPERLLSENDNVNSSCSEIKEALHPKTSEIRETGIEKSEKEKHHEVTDAERSSHMDTCSEDNESGIKTLKQDVTMSEKYTSREPSNEANTLQNPQNVAEGRKKIKKLADAEKSDNISTIKLTSRSEHKSTADLESLHTFEFMVPEATDTSLNVSSTCSQSKSTEDKLTEAVDTVQEETVNLLQTEVKHEHVETISFCAVGAVGDMQSTFTEDSGSMLTDAPPVVRAECITQTPTVIPSDLQLSHAEAQKTGDSDGSSLSQSEEMQRTNANPSARNKSTQNKGSEEDGEDQTRPLEQPAGTNIWTTLINATTTVQPLLMSSQCSEESWPKANSSFQNALLSEPDSSLAWTVLHVYRCQYRPAQLNIAHMTHQLEEAETCRQCVMEQVARLSHNECSVGHPTDSEKGMDARWSAVLLATSTMAELKKAQLQHITQYHQQKQALMITLDKLEAELSTLTLGCIESSTLQAEKLNAFLKNMQKNRGMLEDLLQTCSQISAHLGEAEGHVACIEPVRTCQERWQTLEQTAFRSLWCANICTTEASALLQESRELQFEMELLVKSVSSGHLSQGQIDWQNAIRDTMRAADLAVLTERCLYLHEVSQALFSSPLGKKEIRDVEDTIQALNSQLELTKEKIGCQTPNSSDHSAVVRIIRDYVTWAKQMESRISRRRRMSLFPEEASHQVNHMKKLQSETSLKRFQLASVLKEIREEVTELDEEESKAMLSTFDSLEELYNNTAKKTESALEEMNRTLLIRDRLWKQITDSSSWLTSVLEKESGKSVASEPKTTIPELRVQLQVCTEALKDAERQENNLETLLDDSKTMNNGLSLHESFQLIDRLAALQEEVSRVVNRRFASRWVIEELLHSQESSAEEQNVIQKSLRQIGADIMRQKYPVTRDSLLALESVKHMLMELLCKVPEVPHCPEPRRKEMLNAIVDLQRKIHLLELQAKEHEEYLTLKQQLENSREVMKKSLSQIVDSSLRDDVRVGFCQDVLAKLPLVRMACQETADKIEAISKDLYPSQLTAERQKIRLVVEQLASWEVTFKQEAKILECSVAERFGSPTDLSPPIQLFNSVRQRLKKTICLRPDKKTIDAELQNHWMVIQTIESVLRMLESSRKGKENESYKTTIDLGKKTLRDCSIYMDKLLQAQEALKHYHWAVQGAESFLQQIKSSLMISSTGFKNDREELRYIQQIFSSLAEGFQARLSEIGACVPQQTCLSIPLTEQLHIEVLSCFLVQDAKLEAQAQFQLEALQRRMRDQTVHLSHHEEMSQLLKNADSQISKCFSHKPTDPESCQVHQLKVKVLQTELKKLAESLEELREHCPGSRCSAPVDLMLGHLWRCWAVMKNRVEALKASTSHKEAEWRDFMIRLNKSKEGLHRLQTDLPDSSPLTGSLVDLQGFLSLTDHLQDGIEQEHQTLASLQHHVTRLLGVTNLQQLKESPQICQDLQSLLGHCRSLRDQSNSIRRELLFEMQEFGRVQEEMSSIQQNILSLLTVLQSESAAEHLQEVKVELVSQKARLQDVMERVMKRWRSVPSEIHILQNELNASLQEAKDKLAMVMEKSGPLRKMGEQIGEVTVGLLCVQGLLKQTSPNFSEAERTQKRIWDELDQWHTRIAELEGEVQDLAEQQPERAHILMDQLTQPLQLYQTTAKQAEHRTALISKIPACLQDYEALLSSTNCWLKEAEPWLLTPRTYTTAKCIHGHANSLKMMLDESEGYRAALETFMPSLQEISPVFDISPQKQLLHLGMQNITLMQQSVLEPLSHLQHLAAEMDAIEAEVKTMEKNVTKIRTILSASDTQNISPEEHLENIQVILDNVQSMKRTIDEIESCRPGLGLPAGAEQTLTVFSRSQELLQPIQELQQLSVQHSAALTASIGQPAELILPSDQPSEVPMPQLYSEDVKQMSVDGLYTEEEDEDSRSSSSGTLTCSVPEDPDETMVDEDIKSESAPALTEYDFKEPTTEIKKDFVTIEHESQDTEYCLLESSESSEKDSKPETEETNCLSALTSQHLQEFTNNNSLKPDATKIAEKNLNEYTETEMPDTESAKPGKDSGTKMPDTESAKPGKDSGTKMPDTESSKPGINLETEMSDTESAKPGIDSKITKLQSEEDLQKMSESGDEKEEPMNGEMSTRNSIKTTVHNEGLISKTLDTDPINVTDGDQTQTEAKPPDANASLGITESVSQEDAMLDLQIDVNETAVYQSSTPSQEHTLHQTTAVSKSEDQESLVQLLSSLKETSQDISSSETRQHPLDVPVSLLNATQTQDATKLLKDFSSTKNVQGGTWMLVIDQKKTAGQNTEEIQRCCEALLKGLQGLLDLGSDRLLRSQDEVPHNYSQLHNLLAGHKKYFQDMQQNLVMVKLLFQKLPEGAVQGQAEVEDLISDLLHRAQRQGIQMQQSSEKWSQYEEVSHRLHSRLDELETDMSSLNVEPKGDLQGQLRSYEKLHKILEDTCSQVWETEDCLRSLQKQGYCCERKFQTVSKSPLLMHWKHLHNQLQQKIQSTQKIRMNYERFQRDSTELEEWMRCAHEQLQKWKSFSGSDTPESRMAFTQLMEFFKDLEVRSAQKVSAESTGTQILQLTNSEAPDLRTRLANLQEEWTKLTSVLPALQQTQQELLEGQSDSQILADLSSWLQHIERRLEDESSGVHCALDSSELSRHLQALKHVKAEITNQQPCVNFLNHRCMKGAESMNESTNRSERILLAEQLGAFNLRWLLLQAKIGCVIHDVEDQWQACGDREKLLRCIHSWISQHMEWVKNSWRPGSCSQIEQTLQECEGTEKRLQVKSIELKGLEALHLFKQQDREHPGDQAFSRQLNSAIEDCQTLSQQINALRSDLQPIKDEWVRVESKMSAAELQTTGVIYRLELCRVPVFSSEQSRSHVEQIQELKRELNQPDIWTCSTEVLSNLKEKIKPFAFKLLSDRLEKERIRRHTVTEDVCEDLLKAQNALQLWLGYEHLTEECRVLLNQHWERLGELMNSSDREENTVEMLISRMQYISALEKDLTTLQSNVGKVMEASKLLIGQMQPQSAPLIKSETRLLSRDHVHLGRVLSEIRIQVQEELEEQRHFSTELKSIEKQVKNFESIMSSSTTSMERLKMVLLDLSGLNPNLAALNQRSLRCSLSSAEEERLQTLNTQWGQVFSQATERHRKMYGELLRDQNFQQKCQCWMELLDKMETDLANPTPGNCSSVRDLLAAHQRLKVEFLIGQPLQDAIINEALHFLESSQNEDRSSLLLRLTQLKTRWQETQQRLHQHETRLEELMGQWQLYEAGTRKLSRLFRHMEELLSPAGLAPCSLQQLQHSIKDFEWTEEQLQLHEGLYRQTVKAGGQIIPIVDTQMQKSLKTQLDALKDTWEPNSDLVQKRKALAYTITQNWKLCVTGLVDSALKLDEIKARLKSPLPEKIEDLKKHEQLTKEDEDLLQIWIVGLKELSTMKADVSQYVLPTDTALLQGQVEELHCQWEELCLKVSLRKQEIADRLNAWIIFNDKNKELCDWLTQMEKKVAHRGENLSIEEMVEKLKKDCMEEINLFSENKSHLKQLGEQLLLASDKAKETEIHGALRDVNDRWQQLFDHIEGRGKKLTETLVTVQQLDKNMNNLRSWLTRIEAELSKPVHYSICHREEIQKRLAEQQDLQRDIEQHTERVASVLTLCDVLLHDEDACSSDGENDSIQQTTQRLDQRWRNICSMSLERRLRIEETWRLWCKFQEDYSCFEDWLNAAERTAAEPNSSDVSYTDAKEELHKYEVFQMRVHESLTQLEIINNQYRRLAWENRTDAASRLRAMVHQGNQRWDALQRRVAAILRRLRHFTGQREEFEGTRESLLVWLTEIELQLTDMEHFSESHHQDRMKQLKSFKKEITLNTNKIDALIVFGEGLIQRSAPLDAVVIEDELEELHTYCQEVFGRVARFHQRLTSLRPLQEHPDVYDGERSRETQSPPSSSQPSMCLLSPPQERSGRETPVSVDSIPLEWDHTGDVGGSSSHDEEEEDAAFFSALSGQNWHFQNMPERKSFQLESSSPTHTSTPFKQGYVQLMSECSGSIKSVKRVSMILDDEEQQEEQGLTGLNTADKQSGVIERWELLQAQAVSKEQCRTRDPQQLTSDLHDITSWLDCITLELDMLQRPETSASVEVLEERVKQLKEMQKTFARYKTMMLSLNLCGRELQQEASGGAPELQEGLHSMNQRWTEACAGLERWEDSLRNTLVRCQEFHEMVHSLLLWLAHAESRRYAVNMNDASVQLSTLQEHTQTLKDLAVDLQGRQKQVNSLQDIASELLPEAGGEDSTEAKEKLHVIGSKLRLLSRQVEQDLQTIQERLGSTTDASGDQKSPECSRWNGEPSPQRSFFYRVLRAAFPLHLLFLLLLVLACLVPLSEDDYSCTLSNNFARSFHPMLRYTNGPPPT
nr:nesprin-2-like isoform X1 [Danio rerio]|eukprot:XP_021324291.1 nesprin-2-like isoform X1 [Danio rerio]